MLMNPLANRWIKECVELTITNDYSYTSNLVTDGSLVRFPLNLFNRILTLSLIFFKFKTLDPSLAKGLQIAGFRKVPDGN